MRHECPLCGSHVEELPLAVLPERGMVTGNGHFVILTGIELSLLQRLVDVFPRPLTREAAMTWLYSTRPDREPESKILDVFICKLRKKIEPLGIRIDTLWGRGFVLAAQSRVQIIREAAE